MLATLALLTAIAALSAWYYIRGGYVLCLGIWFNLCAAAYMGFGMLIANSIWSHSQHLESINLMCVAAVVGFNGAYLVTNFRRNKAPFRRRQDYLPSHTSILVVVAFAFAFEAAALLLIGIDKFILSDRVLRLAHVRLNTPLVYMVNLLNVCLAIVFVRYLRFGHGPDRALLALLAVHGLLLAVLTISRYDMAILLLIGCYFLERHRRLHPPAVLAVIAAAFVATLFFKPLLYSGFLGLDYHAQVDFGEYTNWIRHTMILLSSNVETPPGSYALALKSLVVISPEEDALSEWFMKEFFLEHMLLHPGVAYGFSGVWEGYATNGLVGVTTHFAVFGAIFGWLERSPTAMRQVLIVFAMILTYRLFRSEAYNFVKTYAWYFVYPTICIALVDRFLIWGSDARATAQGFGKGKRLRHPGRDSVRR